MKKQVPGFDYKRIYATEDGRIFAEDRELKPYVDRHRPYLIVSITVAKGKYVGKKVHQLVCAAFHGEKPKDKPVVRHLDGNPKNNHASNLCWGTYKENHLDSIQHGTAKFVKGSKEVAFLKVINSRGIHFEKSFSRWIANGCIFGKTIHLGCFETKAEAVAARTAYVKMYSKLYDRGII